MHAPRGRQAACAGGLSAHTQRDAIREQASTYMLPAARPHHKRSGRAHRWSEPPAGARGRDTRHATQRDLCDVLWNAHRISLASHVWPAT